MRRLIIVTLLFTPAGLSASYARGGGMHGRGAGGLTAPANPSVPPSLTPDARLVGAAPLPRAASIEGKHSRKKNAEKC
jgi:hypothetical protein